MFSSCVGIVMKYIPVRDTIAMQKLKALPRIRSVDAILECKRVYPECLLKEVHTFADSSESWRVERP